MVVTLNHVAVIGFGGDEAPTRAEQHFRELFAVAVPSVDEDDHRPDKKWSLSLASVSGVRLVPSINRWMFQTRQQRRQPFFASRPLGRPARDYDALAPALINSE